jgi:hypothetical protein
MATLGADYTALTGKANPFPNAPTPTPAPTGATGAQVAAAVRAALAGQGV